MILAAQFKSLFLGQKGSGDSDFCCAPINLLMGGCIQADHGGRNLGHSISVIKRRYPDAEHRSGSIS